MPYARSINYSQAIKLIHQTASKHRLSTEVVSLKEAANRVVCEDVLAAIDVPAFDCSQMDGFAVNFEQYQQSGQNSMPLGAAIHAGKQLDHVYCHHQAIPIMTGGKLPIDATTVVIKEQTEVKADQVHFTTAVKNHAYIRRSGSDVSQGQVVVKANTQLSTQHIGLLASIGVSEITVKSKPQVALMMTGDELVQPGDSCGPGEIYDANSTMLQLLLEQMGCDVVLYPPLADQQTAVHNRLAELKNKPFDLSVSVGGVSMGDKDWIPAVLDELGDIIFHKARVKPGFPVLFGQLGAGLYFGLPGNPVSAYTSVCQFVMPALRAMKQENSPFAQTYQARLSHPVNKGHYRREFMRAWYEVGADGRFQVSVGGGQQSSRIESLVQANCFLVLDEAQQDLRTGDLVVIQPFAQFSGAIC